MNYVYSANNNMFYPQEYRKQYELNNDWPVDAVDVTDDIFLGFTGKPPEGKRRISGPAQPLFNTLKRVVMHLE